MTILRKRRALRREDEKWGYLFVAPAVILFLLFTAYPVLNAFRVSFQKYRPLGSTFIGLQNYKSTLSSSLFWKALWNTVVYTVGCVPVSLVISLGLSILLAPMRKWVQTIFKAAYYLPVLASGVTLSIVWLWIFSPFETGIFNQILGVLHIPSQNWLGSSKTAMLSLLIMVWLGNHGKNIIIYCSALAGIPNDLYEVADIEGASYFVKIRCIMLPLLKPTTLFLTVTGIITSFQVFQSAYLMTGGGPNHATTTIAYLIFTNAFTYFDFGAACAQALLMALITTVFAVFQFKFMGSDVEY